MFVSRLLISSKLALFPERFAKDDAMSHRKSSLFRAVSKFKNLPSVVAPQITLRVFREMGVTKCISPRLVDRPT